MELEWYMNIKTDEILIDDQNIGDGNMMAIILMS